MSVAQMARAARARAYEAEIPLPDLGYMDFEVVPVLFVVTGRGPAVLIGCFSPGTSRGG